MATIHRIKRGKFPQPKREEYRKAGEYKRRTQKRVTANFSKIYDKDIVRWLEENKPYLTAIKWLIREQIKREADEAEAENRQAN